MSEEDGAVEYPLPDPREKAICETHAEEDPFQTSLYAVRVATDDNEGTQASPENEFTTVVTYFVVPEVLGQFITGVSENSDEELLDINQAKRANV